MKKVHVEKIQKQCAHCWSNVLTALASETGVSWYYCANPTCVHHLAVYHDKNGRYPQWTEKRGGNSTECPVCKDVEVTQGGSCVVTGAAGSAAIEGEA